MSWHSIHPYHTHVVNDYHGITHTLPTNPRPGTGARSYWLELAPGIPATDKLVTVSLLLDDANVENGWCVSIIVVLSQPTIRARH